MVTVKRGTEPLRPICSALCPLSLSKPPILLSAVLEFSMKQFPAVGNSAWGCCVKAAVESAGRAHLPRHSLTEFHPAPFSKASQRSRSLGDVRRSRRLADFAPPTLLQHLVRALPFEPVQQRRQDLRL